MCSIANCTRRRIGTIWTICGYTATTVFQCFHFQCDKSQRSDRRCCAKSQGSWPVYLSVCNDAEKKAKVFHANLFISVLRQYRHRDISSVSADKRFVAFRGFQKYIFDENASAPLAADDHLVVLNVQLNVSITHGWIILNLTIWNCDKICCLIISTLNKIQKQVKV